MNPDVARASEHEKQKEEQARKHLGVGTPEWRLFEQTRNEERRVRGVTRERIYYHPVRGRETEAEHMLRLTLDDKKATIW